MILAAPRTKYRQPFATEAIGKEEGLRNVGLLGTRGQIDRFRDAAVAGSLKSGLYAHVMYGRHIMSGDEEAADVGWDASDVLDRRLRSENGEQRGGTEAACSDHSDKGRMPHRQVKTIQGFSDDVDPVQRFDTG